MKRCAIKFFLIQRYQTRGRRLQSDLMCDRAVRKGVAGGKNGVFTVAPVSFAPRFDDVTMVPRNYCLKSLKGDTVVILRPRTEKI